MSSSRPASARRRVLITGAGSGFGLALAQRYARHGDVMACVDRDLPRAQAAAAGLPGEGHLALQADVGDDGSMQALHAQIMAAWGGVDLLFNNAGIASAGALIDTTMDEWRQVLDIDLLGVVRGCRLFLPDMLAAGSGRIVNTASFAGLAGAPGLMSYGVAKAGVVALSEQLRAELHGSGVGVSVICPAFFRTNLLDGALMPEKTKHAVMRLMERSPDTAESVTEKTFHAVERGEFLILPTKAEPGRWRMKRLLPGMYFKMLLKMSRKRGRPG
jgi:NAD(P)-dependent dehydrogenase (short-subunit alcohol dehydrogenase family)